MGKVRVLNAGMFSTVQDIGRRGYIGLGVSLSGAMDRFSYSISNYLVGNLEDSASLEITLMGPELLFENDELISICGGNLSPFINGAEVPLWTSIRVVKGDVLSFRGVKEGARAYLSFSGGIAAHKILGSYSTNLKAGFGGLKGRRLIKGDEFEIHTDNEKILKYRGNKLEAQYIPQNDKLSDIRVLLGPQEDYFSYDDIQKLFSGAYEVTPACDRMGYRLKGNKISHAKDPNIISDGTNVGSIQIPGDGYPIILMNDCGTTGGYPKIGCVIYSDLDRIAQLKAGDSLRFKPVKLNEAHEAYRSYNERLVLLKEELLNKKTKTRRFEVMVNDNIYLVTLEED